MMSPAPTLAVRKGQFTCEGNGAAGQQQRVDALIISNIYDVMKEARGPIFCPIPGLGT